MVDNVLKENFKYYKSNNPKASISKVIFLGTQNIDKVCEVVHNFEDQRAEYLGLQQCKSWKLYTFVEHPGLLLIKNPFTNLGQRYWIRKCLEEYPKKPNKINLDIERQIENWWAECYHDGQTMRQLQKKLRWTTLGYHHNWDTKIYDEANRTPFPKDLAELADVVACYLGYADFKAQAAIVNYYHMDSTLSAHTDNSEVNLEAPLFSFSFGQSAIFLIGGQDKSIEPSAILLNSGDTVVMTKESRLCYHAVPKILPALTSPWNEEGKMELFKKDGVKFKYIQDQNSFIHAVKKNASENEWERFNEYIKESRININVRQVLKNDQSRLTDNFGCS